jgi:hypothetical protein
MTSHVDSGVESNRPAHTHAVADVMHLPRGRGFVRPLTVERARLLSHLRAQIVSIAITPGRLACDRAAARASLGDAGGASWQACGLRARSGGPPRAMQVS